MTTADSPRRRLALALAVTFAAYLVAARLGLMFGVGPGNASPLYPAAGMALAAVMAWGPAMLPAVVLADLASDLWVTLAAPAAPAHPAAVAAASIVSALGAALQAWVGAWLMRQRVSQPLLLADGRDLANFILLAVPLACLVNATLSTATLVAVGTVGAAAAPATWFGWWLGDTLGALIGAPIAWAFIARPREAWAPRRWSVALPLAAATTVLAIGVLEAGRSDALRAQADFLRDADNAANAVALRLQEPLRALEAMRGVAATHDPREALDRERFRRAAAPWMVDAPGLLALGLSERVPRGEVAAFEARERAAGRPEYRVVERWPAGITPAADDELIAIRFIEPRSVNAGALGVNARSIPLARAAIDSAARTGRPAVSSAFELTQGGKGVVIYQALYHGEPATADARREAMAGVVFATLRTEQLLQAVRGQLPSSLALCLLDNDAPAASRVLAGAAECDRLDPSLALRVMPLAFAGRQWDLRIWRVGESAAGSARAWPLAIASLASAVLLGAFLLSVSGRARRIEAAVAERTAEVEQRSAELQEVAAQRERTAEALRESQQRLRNILDHAPIGVAYTDAEGHVREANPKLGEMLGRTPEQLRSRPIAQLLHAEDRVAEAQARQRLLDGERPMARWQLRCVAADGRIVWVRTVVSVLRDRASQARRLVWVIEDITEHLALEEAQRAREGAEAANRAKSDFLSRMSHELRTPLNAMLGFAQLLELDRKQPLAAHQLQWTAQMRQAGWHLLHMIADTLDLSRIESGHVELEIATLDLGDEARAALALLEQSAAKRGITVELHLAEAARSARGDATHVKQILTNLLSNAIKYNRPGGRVIVASRLGETGRVAVEVIDTGEGMSAEQLAQLFQPFNRLGREAGPIEGTGIGLVISRRLAELMGGALYARSSPGLGSTFTLELPRAAAAPLPPAPHDDAGDLLDARYHRRVVHYVEDNETNVEVMRGILALRPQIQLEVSTLGHEGLAAIRRRKPSLVLLDMQLPDMDGIELLRRLRADDDIVDLPVIVVSADATESAVSQAVAAGATHYQTKPINVPQFLAAVDATLEQLDTHFG